MEKALLKHLNIGIDVKIKRCDSKCVFGYTSLCSESTSAAKGKLKECLIRGSKVELILTQNFNRT